jgi:hypothetical protein
LRLVRSASRLLVLIVVLGIAFTLPVAVAAASVDDSMVLATAEAEEEEAPPEEPVFEEGQEPAVIAPPASESETEQPWTSRFLAPTLLVIGLLALIGAIVYYGVRIRSRYEVVD